ncbi:trehalose-phosphatase [Thermus thermamylovorans]|uniref:Trehalose 6-phosphate phosphatase n=1 Tax=Thermus thermamylovorans TaxID=2509362 RepID=A0A4Q9B511_9DEIN|nr:trehalose-phosphatase [Thermus thermamylovorans]TBH20213.1 trehalose-phosphatase [Thermus thermamylovorans]
MRAANPLFLLDYDGTLAPIAPRPEEALPHPEALEVLKGLMARYPLYVITGRRVADLARLLPLPGLPVVGGHGLEEGVVGGEARPLFPVDLAPLRPRLPVCPGVRVEDKGFALALHFREAADEAKARACLEAWLEAQGELLERLGLEALPGKMVLELKPKGVDKGQAALRLLRRHPGRTPVYVGDDLTDEAAFRALKGLGLTLKVGEGPTQAGGRLRDVEAVLDYLKTYLPGP